MWRRCLLQGNLSVKDKEMGFEEICLLRFQGQLSTDLCTSPEAAWFVDLGLAGCILVQNVFALPPSTEAKPLRLGEVSPIDA